MGESGASPACGPAPPAPLLLPPGALTREVLALSRLSIWERNAVQGTGCSVPPPPPSCLARGGPRPARTPGSQHRAEGRRHLGEWGRASGWGGAHGEENRGGSPWVDLKDPGAQARSAWRGEGLGGGLAATTSAFESDHLPHAPPWPLQPPTRGVPRRRTHQLVLGAAPPTRTDVRAVIYSHAPLVLVRLKASFGLRNGQRANGAYFVSEKEKWKVS